MIKDIYIERDNDGQIIGIGFSQTFCDIIHKHPSVAKEVLKKVEIVSHTGMDGRGFGNTKCFHRRKEEEECEN